MSDYERIVKLIRYLDENQGEQPSLGELAACLEMSPYRLKRLFSEWASITPRDFLQCLTASNARELLREGKNVLDTSLELGEAGSGGLSGLCIGLEVATPKEIKLRGAGWMVRTGFAQTPFGLACIAECPRGICHLSFLEEEETSAALYRVQSAWSGAMHVRDDARAEEVTDTLFSKQSSSGQKQGFRALVRGTAFQVRVWEALIQIPVGSLVTYGTLATAIGSHGGSRAVGTAMSGNEVAYLIPCHRVIRETGSIGNYRWGSTRKRAMIAWENGVTSHAGR